MPYCKRPESKSFVGQFFSGYESWSFDQQFYRRFIGPDKTNDEKNRTYTKSCSRDKIHILKYRLLQKVFIVPDTYSGVHALHQAKSAFSQSNYFSAVVCYF